MPAHNIDMYLTRSLESIIQQSVKNIEIIVVNDGSNDSTALLLELIAKREERLRIIHSVTPTGSPAVARNLALCIAKGDYIAFVDGDDSVTPDFLL